MKGTLRHVMLALLLMAFCWAIPKSAFAVDVSDTTSKPKDIEVNKVYTGKFEKEDDSDCYRFKSGGGAYKVIVWYTPGKTIPADHFENRVSLSYGEYGTWSQGPGIREYALGINGIITSDLDTPVDYETEGKDYVLDGSYVRRTIDIESHKKGKEVGFFFKTMYKGSYKFKVVGKKYVVVKSIKDAKVTVASPTFSGLALKPKVTVKLGSKTLKKGTDYTVSYSNNTNAGSKAVAKIKGKGSYKGTISKKFTIKRKSVANSVQITLSNTSVSYSGKAKKPNFSIYLPAANSSGMVTMRNKVDYTYTYKDNVEPGTAKLVVTGKGNFTGTTSRKFTIAKLKQPATLKADGTTVDYTKIGKTTSIGLKNRKENASVTYSSSNSKVATVNKSGTVTFKGAGTATIKVQLSATKHYKASKLNYTVKVLKQQVITTGVGDGAKIAYNSQGVSLGAALKTGDGQLSFKSSDTSVINVDGNGNLSFGGVTRLGTATITITAAKTGTYAAATKNIKITTVKTKPVLTYQSPQQHSRDEAPFSLGVTVSEPVELEYVSENANLVTVRADGIATINPELEEDATANIYVKSKETKFYSASDKLTIALNISCGPRLYWPVRDSGLNPITGISSHPGDTVAGNAHRGIDIATEQGAGWYAAYGGTVVYVFRGCGASGNESHSGCSPSHPEMTSSSNDYGVVCNNGFGNGCIIRSIIDGRVFYFQYAHMDSVSDELIENMEIQKGAYLGTVGNKGFSFGAHAHFEIDEETSTGSYWGRSTNNDPTSAGCEFVYQDYR